MSTPPPTMTPPEPIVPPAPPAEAQDAFGERKKRGRDGGILAGLLAVLAKGKALLLLLPKLKLLTTSGSMLVSIAAYSVIWGWQFAVGFVILLFVHEMGHVIALRREGVEASAPVFIPFLGAVVWAKSLGGDAAAEARVGLAGPVLGSIGAALCLPLYHATGNHLFQALAFTGFFLNLFNLLPVTPLDGGRAFAAMAPWMWWVGLAGVIALALFRPNPIIIIIAVFAALDVRRRHRERKQGGEAVAAYYRVKPRTRLAVFVVYLGLVAALVLGMDATHLHRTL